ncbi:hypothetical protein AGABI1DRAFT_130798 [Agaricus bisporus var. burnettii JB137-S8]|uniref:Uncharacterized protein n=1 Tax=Agaricus bisporus var. burnettii (strain JB137-S8 / ATCC MYA-4627 / FGSC 10392) TaxID=597362 RepID=K5X2G4_AGABU|nr:uncharacterized protein AGABI1DRAFT_130798 [Agaricus bisporus var. burnettii JB137-S8]EKM77072.1 hypothetical protein AGABI1DRAFT_130798 [Agaricus bisporus var. burnettii JB137-S8]
MVDQIQFLQQKVDNAFVELANYESEKANLEVAKQAGIARRGAGVKLAKLQGSIRGAKLKLSNAEKKLKEALASRVQSSPQQPSLSAIDSHVEKDGLNQLQKSNLSEPEPMLVDNMPIDQPVAPPDELGKGVEGANSSLEAFNALPHNAIPSGNAINASNVTDPSPHYYQVDSGVVLRSFTVSPRDIFPNPTLRLGSSTAQILQAPLSQVMDVSEKSPISFKHMDCSENEEDLVVDEVDMSLITPEDRAQLQQQLFKRRFVVAPPSKKRVKYMEIDDSHAAEDPRIFTDDEEGMERMSETEIANSVHPGVINSAEPKALPPANKIQGSKEKVKPATSKEKYREKDAKGGEGEGVATMKGKEFEKGPKDGDGSGVSEKILGGTSQGTDSEGGDNEKKNSYHASKHTIAKAARAASVLIKQRIRLSDEVAHRQFVEDWLNATSPAERPDLPDGIELVRYDPKYLPDVAMADYDLAIQLLLNQSNNYLCIPHIKLNRRLVSAIDNLEGPVQILGTPLPRHQNPSSKSNIPRAPNHFHCGCHEKVALAGFVMWKTWKAKTFINGQLIVEGLYKDKAFHPREVLFILQFLKSKFGYTVEDMFVGSVDEEEELRKEARVMKKVANYCARRHYELIGQKMTLDDNFPILEEELNMEWI